ncbi:uncharacterized protein LOC141640785 [Silene latifolia]|uniref:uncharacterized protein LOC141640785 n=1 Tax=Silene latifolia TaxID=37657 RepID=UPI003D7752D5
MWVNNGDDNTGYFHGVIKKRLGRNKALLGSMKATDRVRQQVLNKGQLCTQVHWSTLNAPVIEAEIKEVILSIPIDKFPRPDDYTSAFFKDSWQIIQKDVCNAIKDFFHTEQILSQINATNITLIPKCDRPTSVKQFRPIACCNILYKDISKLLFNRLAKVRPEIVGDNQGAFIRGRSIIENVLIFQDLVKLYNRKAASPRCMFKIDLQKAYDTVEWDFVEQLLHGLQFPPDFPSKVMACVRSTSFSLCLNGNCFGYFKGKRGLRQGDPISPLFFNLCMDYLTRMINYATDKWPFQYHPLCEATKLNHLMFADDLLLFYKGNIHSIMLLIKAFSSFSSASGLTMNTSKSEAYYNGVTVPKEEGGLGIKRAHEWNCASTAKLVNWIYTKADRLWIKWINLVYPKGQNWHDYMPPADASWSWKNVCKIKEKTKSGYINDEWIADPKGYSIQSGYEWLRTQMPKPSWTTMVWNRWNIPKHSLISWLIQHQALNTRDKLYRLGCCNNGNCCICEMEEETHAHLFADCEYSSRFIKLMENWCGFRLMVTMTVPTRQLKKSLKESVHYLIWSACYYQIWRQRNEARLNYTVLRPKILENRTIEEMKEVTSKKATTQGPSNRRRGEAEASHATEDVEMQETPVWHDPTFPQVVFASKNQLDNWVILRAKVLEFLSSFEFHKSKKKDFIYGVSFRLFNHDYRMFLSELLKFFN